MFSPEEKAVRNRETCLHIGHTTPLDSLLEIEELFRDTRGRWLYNERQRQCFLFLSPIIDIIVFPRIQKMNIPRFDPKELVQAACKAIDARSLQNLTKISNFVIHDMNMLGSYNNTSRLTLESSLTVAVPFIK